MPETGFTAGWGTLLLVNAAIAHAYGRSRLVWALISLFFGPIATLVLVILGRVEPPAR
jgi:hypothetical protein